MMHNPSRFLFPTLFFFGFLLNFVAGALKTQEEYVTLFKTKGTAFYKDRLLFFTGSESRTVIENFKRGWEVKLTQECLDSRPKDLLVLGDVLKDLGETAPLAGDADFDQFWYRTSFALATVASGTIYVLVPSDPGKWGWIYQNLEKDILIKNANVQSVFELEFDGPLKGKVTKIVKGTAKEFDSIDLMTAAEYMKFLGPEAQQNFNVEVETLTKEAADKLEAKKQAVLARLNARRAGGGGGASNPGAK